MKADVDGQIGTSCHERTAYAMVVDPIDDAAQRFYKGFGFLPLLDDNGRLYRWLAEVAALFQ
jgi:hypothetical protein